MAESKHRYFVDQFDAIAREVSKLAIACDITIFEPGIAEKILKNDSSVCGRQNPKAFEQIRHHLMALFPLEERAIERLGPEDTLEILEQMRASIIKLRQAGSPNSNTHIKSNPD